MRPCLAAALAAGALAVAGPAAAEPLGRLFFSPEQRATLDRQRRGDASRPGPEGTAMRLDGIVARSGGRTTVWINGRPRYDTVGDDSTPARPAPGDPALATIAPAGILPTALRVGEAIDLVTRHKTDVVARGAIRAGHDQADARR